MTSPSNIHLDPAKLFGLSQAMQVTNLNQTGESLSSDLHNKTSEVIPNDLRDLHSKAGEGELIFSDDQHLHSKASEIGPMDLQNLHSKASEIPIVV